MTAHTLYLFTIACLVLALTPGPDMMLFASRTMAQGRKAGFAAMAGALLGCFCQAMAAGLGLSRLFLVVPLAYDAVRLAGAAYLLWLAWTMIRSPAVDQPTTAAPASLIVIARQGLLTNLLNPKVALFMLALLPQFMHPEQGGLIGQVLILSAIQMLTGAAVNAVVVMMSGSLAAWLGRGRDLEKNNARWRRLPNFLLGGVFAGLALRLAWDNSH